MRIASETPANAYCVSTRMVMDQKLWLGWRYLIKGLTDRTEKRLERIRN